MELTASPEVIERALRLYQTTLLAKRRYIKAHREKANEADRRYLARMKEQRPEKFEALLEKKRQWHRLNRQKKAQKMPADTDSGKSAESTANSDSGKSAESTANSDSEISQIAATL